MTTLPALRSGVALSLRGVTKLYAGRGESAVLALAEVDLDLRFGEVTAIVGPSGSGKTTLLSIMGCILRHTSGTITLGEHRIDQMDSRELERVRQAELGFVFQHYNLFPTLRAWQNVAVALEVKGIAPRDARAVAYDLLDQVELSAKAEFYPSDLSGGQKQRVAIARALAGNPKIVLADEPTAALDWQTGRQIMERLRHLAVTQRRAIVVVTHDNRILDYVDRVVRMEDGRITGDTVAKAPLEAVYRDIQRTQPADRP